MEIVLKGAFKEALVCTDQRVLILKNGFMANAFLAANTFQISYDAISSVEVRFGVVTGFFEVSAGGVQTTPKSYWAAKKVDKPQASPNCVSILTRRSANRFRTAAEIILQRAMQRARMGSSRGHGDRVLADLERLAALRSDGTLTEEEFTAQKVRLLKI